MAVTSKIGTDILVNQTYSSLEGIGISQFRLKREIAWIFDVTQTWQLSRNASNLENIVMGL